MSARKKRHSSLASTIAVLGPLESIAGREEVRVKAERKRAKAQRQAEFAQRQAEFDATSLAEDAAEADRLSKKQARQDAKHRMDPALLALRAGLGLATELLHDIQMEMGKQRKYRPQADIYQLKIRLKLDHLGREAPEFPRSVAEVRGE